MLCIPLQILHSVVSTQCGFDSFKDLSLIIQEEEIRESGGGEEGERMVAEAIGGCQTLWSWSYRKLWTTQGVYREPNLGSLGEQYILLTTEFSLLNLIFIQLNTLLILFFIFKVYIFMFKLDFICSVQLDSLKVSIWKTNFHNLVNVILDMCLMCLISVYFLFVP